MPDPAVFSQAMSQRLSRLNAALSQVDEDAHNGRLTPPEAARVRQRALALRQPLLERQAAARQQDQQLQAQEALRMHALQTTMEQKAAAYRASTAQHRVGRYTDPVTGRTAHLYESRPGHMQELEFKDHHQNEDRMMELEARPAPQSPDAEAEGVDNGG